MKKSLQKLFPFFGLVFFLSFGMLALPGNVSAEVQDVVDTKTQQDIIVYQGDLVALKVYSLTRIAVSNPAIVDISNADVNEVLLIGRTVGETPIFIWDENGKRKLMVRVLQEDLDLIMARITKLLEATQIPGITLTKNGFEGKVVLTGKILKDQGKILAEIIKPFEGNVLNLVREEVDMIQIDAQISELNTTLTKALGIDWAAGGADAFQLAFPETLPAFDGSIGDLFKIGNFNRTTAINSTVNALIIEGKGRILSKPSILVSNGENASLLVGGEIPIQTTTTATATGSALTESISYQSYGITLNVTPEIKDERVDMTLSVETRDIDASVAFANTAAFITRSAKTKLNLNDGQTIVLAGLIKHTRSTKVKRLPFLSDIPVVGALFRVKITPSPDTETELVVSLTPRIIRQHKYIDEVAAQKAQELEKAGEADGGSLESAEGTANPQSTDKASTPDAAAEKAQQENSLGEGIPSDDKEATATPSAVETPAPEAAEAATDAATKDATTPTKTTENKDATPNAASGAEEKIDIMKSSTPVNDETTNKAITDYVQKVQKKISQAISFPYEAKEKNWQGTVKLNLAILSDGNLNNATVKESSGHEIFDKDAINTAQIVAPFDAFPADIQQQELIVTIPIIYSQDALGTNQ